MDHYIGFRVLRRQGLGFRFRIWGLGLKVPGRELRNDRYIGNGRMDHESLHRRV